MTDKEAMMRAARSLRVRIGPSIIPFRTYVKDGKVTATDTETGSSVTYTIGPNRLKDAMWRIREC